MRRGFLCTEAGRRETCGQREHMWAARRLCALLVRRVTWCLVLCVSNSFHASAVTSDQTTKARGGHGAREMYGGRAISPWPCRARGSRGRGWLVAARHSHSHQTSARRLQIDAAAPTLVRPCTHIFIYHAHDHRGRASNTRLHVVHYITPVHFGHLVVPLPPRRGSRVPSICTRSKRRLRHASCSDAHCKHAPEPVGDQKRHSSASASASLSLLAAVSSTASAVGTSPCSSESAGKQTAARAAASPLPLGANVFV